jgi:acetyl-CoA carboxylase/biotin carboxylase 1
MAEELIPHFNVAWNDPAKPEAGFKYLYLNSDAKKRFEDGKTKDVITEEIVEDGETRHRSQLLSVLKMVLVWNA